MIDRPDMDAPLLQLRNLTIAFPTRSGAVIAAGDVSLTVGAGEVLGIVGESGSGKSVTSRAIIDLVPRPGAVVDGDVLLNGQDIAQLRPRRLRELRGRDVGMVYQDAASALDPVQRIGRQLVETLRNGLGLDRRAARAAALALLERVGIPEPEARMRAYPHELSGGMRQRVMIALAVAGRPRLLLADEPTTALDVTIQAQILELLASLQAEHGMAMVLVSHDFGVIAQQCDSVAVMYAGRIVEHAPVGQLFADPQHPYTRALLEALLPLHPPTEDGAQPRPIPGQAPSLADLPEGCSFAPRCGFARPACGAVSMRLERVGVDHTTACPFSREIARAPGPRPDVRLRVASAEPGPAPMLEVAGLTKTFALRSGAADVLLRRPARTVTALDDVSFAVPRGGAVGIVGESGSGKTTLARCLVGLAVPDAGRIVLDGVDVTRLSGRDQRAVRQRMQMVFQDPYGSLNPRRSIAATLTEAGRVHGRIGDGGPDAFVAGLLDRVGLAAGVATRRPRELSGGQRQRVAIARALAVNPEVVIADEATSALDVSIQAQILELLADLRVQLGLTLVFISHQLSVIAHSCDSVVVMHRGRIVEQGPTRDVFDHPRDPYTARLLASHPEPDPSLRTAAVARCPQAL
jgi:peptide/nickel transport system ATP-binding protein